MSIWSNLYVGTSGMSAYGDAMGVVGDNIANQSTVGYKATTAGFSDVLGDRMGTSRLGSGVRMSSADTRFGQGSLQQTGNMLDLAISGNGFFVVNGNNNGVPGNYYTRDGRAGMSSDGFLVNNQGLRLQGYAIDGGGNRSASVSDLQLGAGQAEPSATSTSELSLNLDAGAAVPTTSPFNVADPSSYNYATSQTVYDSLGASHKVDFYFRNTGTAGPAPSANRWEFRAFIDGGETTGGTAGTPVELTTAGGGTLDFLADGKLQNQIGNTLANIPFKGAVQTGSVTVSFGDDIANGGTGLTGTTQFAGPSNVTSSVQNGFGFGTLVDLTTSEDGTITGVFSNGQRRPVARLAMADFANQGGLERAGNSLFAQTTKSGQALVDAAATGSRGSITAGAVEMSNVDLGSELIAMITYQRAFAANTKTIQASDRMLQQTTQLIR